MSIGDITSFKGNPIARQGESCTRLRVTNTLDAHGTVTSKSESSETVTVVFGNLTRQKHNDADMGAAMTGDMKVYYAIDTDILEGDFLIDQRNIKWKIEKISALYNQVYGIAFVKNFGLNAN